MLSMPRQVSVLISIHALIGSQRSFFFLATVILSLLSDVRVCMNALAAAFQAKR